MQGFYRIVQECNEPCWTTDHWIQSWVALVTMMLYMPMAVVLVCLFQEDIAVASTQFSEEDEKKEVLEAKLHNDFVIGTTVVKVLPQSACIWSRIVLPCENRRGGVWMHWHTESCVCSCHGRAKPLAGGMVNGWWPGE